MKMTRVMLAALVAVFVVQAPAMADPVQVRIVSKVIDLASQADAVGSTNAITVPGAVLGDACIASVSVDVAGMTVTCYVSAANTVQVRVQNESGGTLDLASATFRVFLWPKGTR